MAEPRAEGSELRLLRCGLRSLAEVELRAPENQRLRLLHLHGNALVTVRGLDAVFCSLEELTLSSNDLQDLEGIQGLQKLRLLDISCNCLSSLKGLESLRHLQELRAAYNQISQLLDLSSFAKPSQLRHLDLRDNAIEHLGQLLFLGGFPLEELRFQSGGGHRGNPICRLPGYRAAVLKAAPDLQKLDEEILGVHERDELPPSAPMVLPEAWPPRIIPRDDQQEAWPTISEAKQQLHLLQEERQQQLQAVAESKAASHAESIKGAGGNRRELPKISQQVQQELKLVAAEAKRRQVMNRELKVKLSQTLQRLQQTKESHGTLELKTQQLQGQSELALLRRQQASMEAQSFQASTALAQSEREEDAAQFSQEIFRADLVLAETEQETQELAMAKLELHQRQTRHVLLKDELQHLQQESDSRYQELPAAQQKLQRGQSRCWAEAAAAQVAMESSQEARELFQQHWAVKASEVESLCQQLGAAEQKIQILELTMEEQRSVLEEEVESAGLQLKEMQAQRQIQQGKKDLEQEEVERRFKEHHLALVAEAKSLQEECSELRGKALEEDRALRGYANATEESQHEEMLLAEALRQAIAQEAEVQAELVAEDAAFERAEDALHLAKAEFSQEENQLQDLQASLRSDFVPHQLLEEEEQFAQTLKRQQVMTLNQLETVEQEEKEAAQSLASSSPDRIQEELSQMQAWVHSMTFEFQQADGQMDAMQSEVQRLQEEVAAQHVARSKRDADWQRAELEVRRRVQKALAQEEAASDVAEALQEELDGLKQESEHYDEDIFWLEENVEQATEMWSSMPSGFTHAEQLEAQSLQQARQAQEQLSSLGLALSKELQKHREANQSLSKLVESEQEELQGYTREEKLMQEAWNKERQALAEEAATVAAELQRLANGL